MARRTKRLWTDEEKRSICFQTTAAGVSVAQVARRYAMNANMIFKWLRYPASRLAVELAAFGKYGRLSMEEVTAQLDAAPILDALSALQQIAPGSDLLASPKSALRAAYLDVFDLFMLPLLDGIMRHEVEKLLGNITAAFDLAEGSEEAEELQLRTPRVAV